MSLSGPILVFLAYGTRGSAVARVARRRGHSVRALVRSDRGVPDQVLGDLDDPDSLIRAARGCAHAVLQLPTDDAPVMLRQARHAIDALVGAGIDSVVLILASASRPAPCPEPSFVANAAVEALVRGAPLRSAVVRPTLYLDNLLKPSARADLVERSLFSPPIAQDQAVAWTSVDDTALAAVMLLEQERYGGDHRIAGPESVTGEGLAARLSSGLGRRIAYRAEPVDAFERDVAAAMGPELGSRIAAKFRYFQDHPDDADRILADAWDPALLRGFAPTSIEAWARARRDRLS